MSKPDDPYQDGHDKYIEIEGCYGVFNRQGELQYIIRKQYEKLAIDIPPEYVKMKIFRGNRTKYK